MHDRPDREVTLTIVALPFPSAGRVPGADGLPVGEGDDGKTDGAAEGE
jgi:hypothetical protein